MPIGDAPLAEINLLVPHYQDRLGITSRVLPSIKLDSSDVDTSRRQLIAENVIDSMVRTYPTYAADKAVVLIGITRQDMYPRSMDWRYCFGWRTAGNTAVVSTARMEGQDPALPRDPSLLSTRLRKMVTKDIGVMYFGMALNADPNSVLYGGVQGLEDLDQTGENLDPKEAPAVTERPAAPVENDGSFPVWRISLEGDHAASELKGTLASRKLTVAGLQKENSLEVDLRSGKFVVQRTDLFVPDAIPLALTRSYYNFGQTASSGPFGGGSSLNYDISPFGSRDPYTFINLYVGDGNYLHFDRISKGTGNEDAVYVHTQTTLFDKARFWWSGGGWILGLPDGTTYLLPENYNGKTLAQGAPYEMRSPQGLRVQYDRDGQRRLRRVLSPGGRSISLELNETGSIIDAHDDKRHRISYVYDDAGRLAAVRDNGALAVRYVYDDHNMLAVFDGAGKLLVQNRYSGDRLTQQVLANGKVYGFRYIVARNDDAYVLQTIVTLPDQSQVTFNFRDGVLLTEQRNVERNAR